MSEALIQAIAKQVALARGAHCWEDTPGTERRTCRAYATNALHEADKAPSPVQRVEELEAALKPFAAVGEKIATCVPDQLADLFLVKIEGEDRIKHFPTLTISDFAFARALLDSKEGK